MPRLSRIWWTPLAFVIVALIALLVTPLAVEHRVGRLRGEVQNGAEHGRLLLNDLEAAFASQLLAGPATSPADTNAVATAGHLAADESELRATMDRVGPEASARFEALYDLIHSWSAAHAAGRRDSTTVAEARRIFATAEDLDNYLMSVSVSQRERVRGFERINVISAIVLAPIALIAVGFVIWSGGRVVSFAAAAEQRRLEVVRAAEARTALLRGVTHDVKNPLGAAAGYAQLLEEGVVGAMTAPQSDMLKRIRRLVQQAVDTVTDLLELAHADSGGLQIEYAHADLAQLAREVVDDHRGSATESGLSLEFAGEPAPMVTDPRRVRQVLGNLITNAIKYTPANGHVRVSIAQERARVGVRVEDDGPGIPPELRRRVFEEFFRVHSSERRDTESRGNGLGLAISRRIATLIGGDVTFQPAEPHGAIFTLWLDRK